MKTGGATRKISLAFYPKILWVFPWAENNNRTCFQEGNWQDEKRKRHGCFIIMLLNADDLLKMNKGRRAEEAIFDVASEVSSGN
jgi:hypothetical protein